MHQMVDAIGLRETGMGYAVNIALGLLFVGLFTLARNTIYGAVFDLYQSAATAYTVIEYIYYKAVHLIYYTVPSMYYMKYYTYDIMYVYTLWSSKVVLN